MLPSSLCNLMNSGNMTIFVPHQLRGKGQGDEVRIVGGGDQEGGSEWAEK